MLPGGPPAGGGRCLLRWLGLRLWSRRGTVVFALLWFGSWLVLNGLVLVHRSILSDYCTDDKSKRILQRLVSPNPKLLLWTSSWAGSRRSVAAMLGRAGLTGTRQNSVRLQVQLDRVSADPAPAVWRTLRTGLFLSGSCRHKQNHVWTRTSWSGSSSWFWTLSQSKNKL